MESIAILTQLIRYRDCLTPDFIHFITCVVEDEAHFVCVTLYWLFWKCFLTIDPNLINKYDTKRRVEDRVKIVARAIIELAVSLLLMGSWFEYSFYPWLYCLSVFIFVALRSVFSEYIDLTAMIFVFMYFCQNFIVNLIDFAVFKQYMGFYHDDLFLRMFSYKLFQAVLCLMISFIYAQSFQPTFDTIKETPGILAMIFKLTLPCNVLMLFTFVVELSFYDQHQR